jgi:hypothetical protein
MLEKTASFASHRAKWASSTHIYRYTVVKRGVAASQFSESVADLTQISAEIRPHLASRGGAVFLGRDYASPTSSMEGATWKLLRKGVFVFRVMNVG